MVQYRAIKYWNSIKMVPGAGLEPARPYERGILNPLCLPISPPGHRGILAFEQAGNSLRKWRRNPESNRDTRICNPLHSQSAIPPKSLDIYIYNFLIKRNLSVQ